MLIIQPQEGVYSAIPTEEVEMEILVEEEDDEGEFSAEEEVEEIERREQVTDITSPKVPVENKRESTGSLEFSKELSSILANKMSTLNDNESENVSTRDEITKEEKTNTKETNKRRKPPPPPVKPKV